MKTQWMAMLLAMAAASIAGAQNFMEGPGTAEFSALPVATKAEGIPADPAPLFLVQNTGNLGFRERESHRVPAMAELPTKPETAGEDLNLLSATYRELAKPSRGGDCPEIALALAKRVENDPSLLLETVATEVGASPACACEIVKAAIQATGGEVATVIGIVETAITASPENMRLISQCAIATAPEALAEIQALLAKLDPNGGEGTSAKSAKSSKSGKDMVAAARLDAEPENRANPLEPSLYFWAAPPPILPPEITRVNP